MHIIILFKKLLHRQNLSIESFNIVGFLSVVFFLLGNVNANATSHGNNLIFTSNYSSVGNWSIMAGSNGGDTCIAELSNGGVSLRLQYTQYTGDWFVGNPYYEDNSPVGEIGFNHEQRQSVTFDTRFANGWAMLPFYNGDDTYNALINGSSIVMNIDRGLQVWSLSGSRKAMAMVEECAKNMGKRPINSAAKKRLFAKLNQFKNKNKNECPSVGSMKSPDSGNKTTIEFVDDPNGDEKAVVIYWLDYNGNFVDIGIPDANGRLVINTYMGHKFVAKTHNGECRGGVFEAALAPVIYNIP